MILRGVARAHHSAFAGDDLFKGAARRFGVGKQAALTRRLFDRAIDVAGSDVLSLGDAFIQRLQHTARMFAGVGLALQRDMIAIGEGGDLQASFDPREVLVIETEDKRGVFIIFEGERDFRIGFVAVVASRRDVCVMERGHAAASPGSSHRRAASELEPAEMISTCATSPIMRSGPSTCTACK